MNKATRDYALDLMRGLTIALMIVVNNPGDWKAMFTMLHHAEWDGFLGADIVFPFFLFVSGFAAALRLRPRLPHCATALTLEPDPDDFYQKLFKRTLLLLGIGVLLNIRFGAGGEFSLSQWRIPGVLQRIAICSALGSVILHKVSSVRGVILALVALAATYELGMRVLGNGSFALENNFARTVDLAVFPEGMLYKVKKIAFDPEGLFSSLTATMTFLFGALLCRLKESRVGYVSLLLIFAIPVTFVEPVNKNLWTLSYTLWTAAAGVFVYASLQKLSHSYNLDRRRIFAWILLLGRHALFVYVLSCVIAKPLAFLKLSSGITPKRAIFDALSIIPADPRLISLLYSLLLLALLYALTRIFRERKLAN